jgi:hypothetical protein
VLMSGFQRTNNARFGEITVERINVVDKDGHNRMIISNDSRMPGPIQRDKSGLPIQAGQACSSTTKKELRTAG